MLRADQLRKGQRFTYPGFRRVGPVFTAVAQPQTHPSIIGTVRIPVALDRRGKPVAFVTPLKSDEVQLA